MDDRLLACGAWRFARICAFALGTALLAGCVDTATPTPESAAPVHQAGIVRRPGVSPNGASVALAGFAGGPQQLDGQFQALFGKEAQSRDITLAEAAKADYVVRGYLNASPQGAKTNVAIVLDVFDGKHRRAQRIEDEVDIPAAGADPWSAVDPAILSAVAAKSAEDLAAFLTNTPEAVAAAETKGPSARAALEGGETSVAASAPAPAPASPIPAPHGAGFASLH